jgi:DNA-binding response OmpR family regulator
MQAVKIVKDENIHLVLLDIMMPQMDGIEALVKIREFSNVPVIFLTAKGEDTDKILGLNVGADDYVSKPFNPMEVCARVRSQLRRYMQLGSGVSKESLLVIGGIELNDDTKQVTLDGEQINLTPTEFAILRLFMEHPGRVFSPKEIYEKVWNDLAYGSEGTVAVHIRHLREKIEINPAEPRYLKVVWGQGYKIEKGVRG